MVEGHYKPGLFNPMRQPPGLFKPQHESGVDKSWVETPGVEKKDSIKLKDILTMYLSTPSFNQGLFTLRWLKSPSMKSLGLRNPGLKSSLLKSPGLKLGVEKSGIEAWG